jgi:hypothetical protein
VVGQGGADGGHAACALMRPDGLNRKF